MRHVTCYVRYSGGDTALLPFALTVSRISGSCWSQGDEWCSLVIIIGGDGMERVVRYALCEFELESEDRK